MGRSQATSINRNAEKAMNVSINVGYRRRLAAALLATAAVVGFGELGTAAKAQTAAPAEQFGEAHFPISCSDAAQRQFDRAIAMLHSFFFPETGITGRHRWRY